MILNREEFRFASTPRTKSTSRLSCRITFLRNDADIQITRPWRAFGLHWCLPNCGMEAPDAAMATEAMKRVVAWAFRAYVRLVGPVLMSF
jgi:hypothetical protein